MNQSPAGLAVRKSITVEAPIEVAFEVFTEGITTWWPMATHSLSGDGTRKVTLEGRTGGRLYETNSDGKELDWGSVTMWDPPSAVAFTWHLDRPANSAQLVEVSFSAEGTATRVDLVHTGWERLGEEGAGMAKNYDTGWDFVLDHYVERVSV
jgi:uncharacterized protein YndB with AHSA1/START domain